MTVENYSLRVRPLGDHQWVIEGHPVYPSGLIGPGNPQGHFRRSPFVRRLAAASCIDEVARLIEWVGRFRVMTPDLDDHRFRVVGGGRQGRDLFIGGVWSGTEESLANRRVRPLVSDLLKCENVESAQNVLDLGARSA